MIGSRRVEIPLQEEGIQSDVVESRRFNTIELAIEAYMRAKKRLFAINNWGHISKGLSASFTLIDGYGNKLEREPWVKDFIRIDIPGPGSQAGHGYDWVQIEAIEEFTREEGNLQGVLMTVRPSHDPQVPEGPAHFFDASATSSFLVEIHGLTVSAAVHGRNEHAANTENPLDTLRNKVVTGIASLGASQLQWKKLCEALLDE